MKTANWRSLLWRPGPPVLMYLVLVILLLAQLVLTQRGIRQNAQCLQHLEESRKAADDLMESDRELKAADDELQHAVEQIREGRQ